MPKWTTALWGMNRFVCNRAIPGNMTFELIPFCEVLGPYLDDEGVSEIEANFDGSLFVEKHGETKLVSHSVRPSEASMFCKKMATEPPNAGWFACQCCVSARFARMVFHDSPSRKNAVDRRSVSGKRHG